MTLIRPTQQTYNELQEAFDLFNQELFDDALPECLITLQREKKTCGYFSPKRFVNERGGLVDEIALNPQYFDLKDITETLATLLHEMVHQWQYHFGNPSRPGYHNKEWAAKMQEVGLMPSTTGAVGGKRTGFQMADYPIESGAFLGLVELLQERAFVVSWADRFKPMSEATGGALKPLSRPQSVKGGPIVVLDGVTGEIKHKKQTRAKFSHRCINGKIENIWGREGLRVNCAVCGEEFLKQE